MKTSWIMLGVMLCVFIFALSASAGIPLSRHPAVMNSSSGQVNADSINVGDTQLFWAYAEGFFTGYYPLSATCQLVSEYAYLITEDAYINDISAPADSSFNPDSLILFAACNGALFKSYDSGLNWQPSIAGLPDVDGTYDDFDSTNYNRRSNLNCLFTRAEYGEALDTIWVGTEYGPFWSLAAGDTFMLRASGMNFDAEEGVDKPGTYDILGHPVNTKTLWAATDDGVYMTRNANRWKPLIGLPPSQAVDWVQTPAFALAYEPDTELLFAVTDKGIFYGGMRPLSDSPNADILATWKPLGGTVALEYFSVAEDYLKLRVTEGMTSHGLPITAGQNITIVDVTQNIYWLGFVDEFAEGLILEISDEDIFYYPEGDTPPEIDYRSLALGHLEAYGYAQVTGPSLYLEVDGDETTAYVGTEGSGLYSYQLTGDIKDRYHAPQLTISNSHDGMSVYRIAKKGDLYYIATDQGLFTAEESPHDEWTRLTGYIKNNDGTDSLAVNTRDIAFGPNDEMFIGGYMGGFLRSMAGEDFATSNHGLIHRNGTIGQLNDFLWEFEHATPADTTKGIWELMQEWWGEFPGPESGLDIDGDPRVVMLFLDVIDNFYEGTQGNGTFLNGYYDGQNEFPRLQFATSNQAEMIYLDTDPQWINRAGSAACNQVFHLINWNQDFTEDLWLRGGLSYFSQWVAGYPTVSGVRQYGSDDPTISGVVTFPAMNNLLEFNISTRTGTGDSPDIEYLYSFLFMLYLYEQMFPDVGAGEDLIHGMTEIATSPYQSVSGLGRLIYEKTVGASSDTVDYTPEFVDVFDDFIIAGALDISDSTFHEGKYGFINANSKIAATNKNWYWPADPPPPYNFQMPFWSAIAFQMVDLPAPKAFFNPEHPLTDLVVNGDDRNQLSFFAIVSDSADFTPEMPKDLVEVLEIPVDPVKQKGKLSLPEELWLVGGYEVPNNVRVLAICNSGFDETPSCFTFGDDTTSAPDLFISVAQNPIDERYIDIYSFCTERMFPDGGQLYRIETVLLTELEGPEVDITGGTATDTGADTTIALDQDVFFSNAAGSAYIYHIAYHLDRIEFPADLEFTAYGEDICGNEKSSDPLAVTVDFIESTVGGALSQAESAVSLYIPPLALQDDAYIMLSVTDYPTEFIAEIPSRTIAAPSDPSHYAVGPLVSAGSAGLKLSSPVELEIPFDPVLAGNSEVGVYRSEGDGWVYVGGVADEGADVLKTYSWKFGQFQAFAGPLGDMKPEMPYSFRLDQNYPNPFNPVTRIEFELTKAQNVKVDVYNLMGRLVARLTDDNYDAGRHTIEWKPINLSSGMYFLRLEAQEGILYRKMMLLK